MKERKLCARSMVVTPLVLLVLLAPDILGCGSPRCGTVIRDADGITGSMVYAPASTTTPYQMSSAAIWSMGTSSLEVDVTLTSPAMTRTRSVRLVLSKLTPGAPQELSSSAVGEACVILQENTAPTCLPLSGTVEVKRLHRLCDVHSSGIATCADDVDVKLRAKAEESGLEMAISLDVVRTEHWSDPSCE